VVVYVYLLSRYTYTKVVVTDSQRRITEERKVIGGFHLTERARDTIAQQRITVQDFFKGTAYDADSVWTRGSLSLSKLTFVAVYIALIACGTLALTAAALLVTLRQ